MKKAILVLASVASLAMIATAPAEARGWRYGGGGWGPAVGFGLAAGALAAGAYAASRGPYAYYDGPAYSYGPAYDGPAYYSVPSRSYPGYGYYGGHGYDNSRNQTW